MLVDQAPLPSWRSAETYRPLLRADPAVWALEFGRRGLSRDASGQLDEVHGAIPDLCFASAGPQGDPIPVAVWRWQADPSVPVLSVSPAAADDPDALDVRGLGLAALVVRTASEQHVVISDGARRLRFAVVEGDVLAGPVRCRFLLPPHSMSLGSLEALRLLITLRDTGRLPASGYRPPPKAARWLEILRAHDARLQGASQRDIAMLLFGEARVREDWAGRSEYMRMRVQRLLRSAESLVAGGYRALCGLRVGPRDKPKIIGLWRSPAWRGGGPAIMLLSLSSLGTVLGMAATLHAACCIW